jgi:hypothetical protein
MTAGRPSGHDPQATAKRRINMEGMFTARAAEAPRRAALLVLVAASLACAPVSWIDDGVTPSFIVYPVVLLVGLWRVRKGGGTLYFGIAATVFLLVHVQFTWEAFFGDQNPLGADKMYNPVQWAITLFAVPLLTMVAGFLAWREARR